MTQHFPHQFAASTTIAASRANVLAVLIDPEKIIDWVPLPCSFATPPRQLEAGQYYTIYCHVAGQQITGQMHMVDIDLDRVEAVLYSPITVDFSVALSEKAPGQTALTVDIHQQGTTLAGRLLSPAVILLLKGGLLSRTLHRISTLTIDNN